MKLSAIIWLMMVMSGCTQPGQAAGNLLQNGDFENWPQETGAPQNWQFSAGQTPEILHKDTAQKHAGAASLRFNFAPPNSLATIEQAVTPAHPDTQYLISGFIKSPPDTQLQLRLEIETNVGGMDLPKATEWTPWEMTFNSQDATRLLPQFRFRGISGTVWLDDIRLEQIGKAGASVLPARAELLKLLRYQANPVDPATNTDEWTKPLRNVKDAGSVFRASNAKAAPQWKVGQWARYLCRDELLVPSTTPEKRPQIAVIDCAIVGEETIAGKKYFWYQSVVRLDKYWVAKSTGRYDSGEKILLDTDRKIVLSFLVDGPAWKEVRRYQLKVDDEPLLEYTDGQRAVLPKMNIDHALIRPSAKMQAAKYGTAPVIGALDFQYSGPQLERSATLINWGDGGAKDERGDVKPVVVKLPRPPYFGIAFDGFGELKHFKEMVAAGADLFENQTILYRGEARAYFNQMPAYFYNSYRWDADAFDICRSNLLGFTAIIDEAYERQLDKNEYVKKGEAKTLTEAAELYSSAFKKLTEGKKLWPGEEIKDFNTPASVAWYGARAGAPGFVFENSRLTSSELPDIERVTGKKDARALADEINIGFLSGAARRFGTWWGNSLYKWIPERYWKDELVSYAGRGAKYTGFWIEGFADKDPNLEFYQKVRKMTPEIRQAVKAAASKPRRATAVIVVPFGHVVGGGEPGKPWGLFDLPQGRAITDQVIARAAALFDKGITFDIVYDDPDFPPALAEYQQVVRVGF